MTEMEWPEGVDAARMERAQAARLAFVPPDFGAFEREDKVLLVRALSLWQPFASMVASGLKPIETRLQKTDVRGRFVVCATQKVAPPAIYDAALRRMADAGVDVAPYRPDVVVRGSALAIAKLTGCREMTPADEPLAWVHYLDEDTGKPRWAWETDPAALKRLRPFHVSGGQRWFRIPAVPLLAAGALDAA